MGGDERGLLDRPQLHQPGAIRPVLRCPEANLRGQPRLAHPARAREGHEPSRPDARQDAGKLFVAPQERRRGRHQVVAVGREARTAGRSDANPSPASWKRRTGSSKSRTRKRPSGSTVLPSSAERRSSVAPESSTCPPCADDITLAAWWTARAR